MMPKLGKKSRRNARLQPQVRVHESWASRVLNDVLERVLIGGTPGGLLGSADGTGRPPISSISSCLGVTHSACCFWSRCLSTSAASCGSCWSLRESHAAAVHRRGAPWTLASPGQGLVSIARRQEAQHTICRHGNHPARLRLAPGMGRASPETLRGRGNEGGCQGGCRIPWKGHQNTGMAFLFSREVVLGGHRILWKQVVFCEGCFGRGSLAPPKRCFGITPSKRAIGWLEGPFTYRLCKWERERGWRVKV